MNGSKNQLFRDIVLSYTVGSLPREACHGKPATGSHMIYVHDFWRKRPKWCPKIALYLENGYSYRKSDSIFGIYGKASSDFGLLVVFWVKIRPKDSQFSHKKCILGWFLENILVTTTSILIIFGQ